MQAEPVRILAVDDVPENLAALEALLSGDGVELLTARSGVEALELLLLHDVALALLDVQMPGMDGFELAEFMRGTERTRNVPIIFLTAVATDERRHFRGYEAGAVDYLLKPLDAHILRTKVGIFVELYRQRRELAQQRDDHAAALARLKAHSDNSPLAIVELDRRHCISAWSNGAERLFGWRSAEVAGFPISDFKWLAAEDAAAFAEAMGQFISGQTSRATLTAAFNTAEGFTLACECYCSALTDPAGRLISVNLQILDVSERRRAEETQRLLIGELNHRVKNTLASVQAIAQQTLRHSSGPVDFAPTFLGRIRALAAAHSLLSDATWRDASLRELIEGQLAIGAVGADRLRAEGPDLELAPEPALHLALVLHELVTNAHKYGALSVPHGRIELFWRVADGMLELDWAEQGGPPVAPPSRKGFGSALIERSLQADGGSAVPTYGAGGIGWRLAVPVLSLPRKTAAPRPVRTQVPAPDLPAQPACQSPALAGWRVLVIEDEPLVAMEIDTIIEDAGGTVVAILADAGAAIAAIGTARADCALLDGNLHGQPVDEIAGALRAAGVPFLFVSGYGRESLPSGFDGVPLVNKPFETHQLLDDIRSLIPAKAAARGN